jgi:glycosyltransferase involved in cell wall biosynthesis
MTDPVMDGDIVVGIDASRNRSGGAVVHLVGILEDFDPSAHGIREVHVWSYRKLLDALPERPWLKKHNPPQLQQSLLHQVWWQYRSLPVEARTAGCEVMLNTDAGTVSRFRPAITMSRDMLPFEPREMRRYGWSSGRLRFVILKYLHSSSLRRADGAIFLTNHAAEKIQEVTGRLPVMRVIPHGVSDRFRQITLGGRWSQGVAAPIRVLYVSNAEPYKHQWVVVKAVDLLRKRGHDIHLLLVGGGKGAPQKLIDDEIERTDPGREFTEIQGFARHEDIPALLGQADLFVFASSCENMPNTLVEAMASGLPIACSDRGPMPEVLQDGGSYFDPEDAESIAAAIERMIVDREFRVRIALRAKELSAQFSWRRCAKSTFSFLADCARKYRQAG